MTRRSRFAAVNIEDNEVSGCGCAGAALALLFAIFCIGVLFGGLGWAFNLGRCLFGGC